MLLSLHTISQAFINEEYDITVNISDGFSKISGFALYISNNHDSRVGKALLKVANDTGDSFILSYDSDSIIIRNSKMEKIINTLSNIFEYYNSWERSLYDILADDLPLQNLLEVAHSVFKRPMFIKGDSSWVYAITFGYDTETHPYWAQLERSYHKKFADFDPIKIVSTDPEFQSIFKNRIPTIQQSPLYKGPVLETNIWIDEKRICEILVLEHGKPFSQSDIHVLQTFCAIVEKYILKHKDTFFEYQGLSFFFMNLLSGNEYTPAAFKLARQMSGWPESDQLAVVALRPKHPKETPLIGVIRDTLIDCISDCKVLQHEDVMVCLANVNLNKGYGNLIKKMADVIPVYASYWGISYEFYDFADFKKYYKQALESLEYAIEENVSFRSMYQISYKCMINKLTLDHDLDGYIHPLISLLRKHDLNENTEYVKTLFAYMICGQNFTDASAMLKLHRNTLIYRINNIQKMSEIDLNDLETKKLLLLSLFILEKET